MGRAHASDVFEAEPPCEDAPGATPPNANRTRTDGHVPSASWIGRLPPNARIAAFVVLLGGGSGAGTSLLGTVFGRADPEVRRDVDANAAAIAGLTTRLDKCDAQVNAVAEDGREMQLWIASSMPMIATGLEIVGKAVGADVKIPLPELPGRGRR